MKFDSPMYLTLPALTMSSSACIVSASGVTGCSRPAAAATATAFCTSQ